MENCGCRDGDIERITTPPYVSQESLQRFLDGRCVDCNEAIDFDEEPTYPECCDDQIVLRGDTEVLRVKDASNMSYVGVGGTMFEFMWGSTGSVNLLANTLFEVPFSSGSVTAIKNDIGFVLSSNRFTFPRSGLYIIDMSLDLPNTTQTNFHVMLNGSSFQRYSTHYNTGVNPTSSGSVRRLRMNHVAYFVQGNNFGAGIVVGSNITSAIGVNIRVVRLSVT